MKKNIWIFGGIGGLISSIWLIIIMFFGNSGSINFEAGMWIGYSTMLVAFSMIFVAVKNYRDKYNEGWVSFGKAFRIGLYITLIASSVYVVVWLIDFYFFVPDFIDKYAAHMQQQLEAQGLPKADIDKQMAEMADFAEMYKNPLFNALVTYTEILPIGLIVSLIAALILKRKRVAVA